MNFKRIRTGEAKALLDQGNLNIADIRDELSYEAGHIRGAVRVDNSNLQQFMQGCDKDAPLVVCCYHGNSSQGAAQFFASQGPLARYTAWMAAMKCGNWAFPSCASAAEQHSPASPAAFSVAAGAIRRVN